MQDCKVFFKLHVLANQNYDSSTAVLCDWRRVYRHWNGGKSVVHEIRCHLLVSTLSLYIYLLLHCNEGQRLAIKSLSNCMKFERLAPIIQRCCVIGGGFIGIEMVENLRHMKYDVTLIDVADQIMTPMDKCV